jgi:hypothetical protein
LAIAGSRALSNAALHTGGKPMLEIFGDSHLSWIDVATGIALSDQARQFRLCLPLVATEGHKLADPLSADGITAKVESDMSW